jgi:hypothetical protein
MREIAPPVEKPELVYGAKNKKQTILAASSRFIGLS